MSLEKEIKELRELADNHLADKKELEAENDLLSKRYSEGEAELLRLEKLTGGTHWTNRIYDLDNELLELEKKNRTLSFKLENIVKVAKEKDGKISELEEVIQGYIASNNNYIVNISELEEANKDMRSFEDVLTIGFQERKIAELEKELKK